jgi:protocatechuate 3,4-dioxygenase beta subunit
MPWSQPVRASVLAGLVAVALLAVLRPWSGSGEGVRRGGGDDAEPVVLETRAPTEPPRLAGAPAPPVGTTTVRVVRPGGEAVRGAVVVAQRTDGPGQATARAGVDGRVGFALPAGAWDVFARHERLHGAPVALEVPAEREALLVLAPGVRLEVLVVDLEGRPVEGARVEEAEWGTGFPVTTGADGIADLGAVHPAWAFLRISKEGWLERGEWANSLLQRGDAHRLNYRLSRGATLTVRTTELDGTPVPDASLWLTHKGGDLRTKTDGAGVAVLAGAALPGEVRVIATSKDGRQVTHIGPGPEAPADRTLTLQLPAPTTWAGTVRAVGVPPDGGAPIGGAAVHLEDPWGDWTEVARTGADGRFRIFPAPVPGERDEVLDLLVLAPGWAQSAEDLDTVPLGEERRTEKLDVRLVPTRTVRGRVTDREGTPVAGATVEVTQGGRSPPEPLLIRTGITGADGRYEVADVAPWEGASAYVAVEGRGHARASLDDEDGEGLRSTVDLRLSGEFRLDVPVEDEDGAPVERAWLTLMWDLPGGRGGRVHRGVEGGRFHPVPGLPLPAVVAEVAGPQFLPGPVRVSPETKRLVLDRPHAARGMVIDEEGRPVTGADVRFESIDRLHTLEGNAAQEPVEADGTFEVKGLRRGRYAVHVVGRGLRGQAELRRDGEDLGRVVVR